MYKGSHKGDVKMDLVGRKIGSLTVLDDYIRVQTKDGSKIKFLCRCECGAEQYCFRDALLRRRSPYCPSCRPSGVRKSKLYHIYYGMRQRCYNEKTPAYRSYGAKGIHICDEWLASFEAFRTWAVSHGYKDGLTIDRIDSSGDYCPQNCEWVPLGINSARANYGRHKNHSKLIGAQAYLPDGTSCPIDNISKFSREHGLNASSVSAALHGRINPNYHGYTFHSNKTQQKSVTTIENTSPEKA